MKKFIGIVICLLIFTQAFSHGTSDVNGKISFFSTSMSQSEKAVLYITLTSTHKKGLENVLVYAKLGQAFSNPKYDLTRINDSVFSLTTFLENGKYNLRVFIVREGITEIGLSGFEIKQHSVIMSPTDSELWFVPMGKFEPVPVIDHISGVLVAVVFIILIFLSLKKRISDDSKGMSQPLWVLVAACIAALSMPFGAYWDIAFHTQSGRESFLQPPHLLIYGGILTTLLLMVFSILKKPKGITLRKYFSENPFIKIAFYGLGLQIISAPFDEFWHNTFGLDVSVWSPPHTLLIFGGVTVCFALAGVPLKTSNNLFVNTLRFLTLSGGLLICEIFLAEFEFRMPSWHISQFRPFAVYIGLMVLFVLTAALAAKKNIRYHYSATITVVIFLIVRLLIHPFLQLVGCNADLQFFPWLFGLIFVGLMVDYFMNKKIKKFNK